MLWVKAVSYTHLIPPKKYIDSFSLNKYFIDTTTSGINQKFLEIFIKRGLLENHLEKLRLNLKMKMEYIINELQKIKHLEIMHIPKGGFFIWVNLANYINRDVYKRQILYHKPNHLHQLSIEIS